RLGRIQPRTGRPPCAIGQGFPGAVRGSGRQAANHQLWQGTAGGYGRKRIVLAEKPARAFLVGAIAKLTGAAARRFVEFANRAQTPPLYPPRQVAEKRSETPYF